jgi:hypothetical protein
MNVNPDHVLSVITFESEQELETLLNMRWPDHRIPAVEFQQLTEGIPKINNHVWHHHTGLGRKWYNTHEVAELLWRLADENTRDPDE